MVTLTVAGMNSEKDAQFQRYLTTGESGGTGRRAGFKILKLFVI